MDGLPRDALIAAIARHPALRRYVQRVQAGGHPPSLRTAGDVLGERLGLAFMLLDRPLADFMTGPGMGALTPAGLEAAARALLRAVPFLWRSELVLAAHASRLPPHVADGVDAPYPLMWWTFEDALQGPPGSGVLVDGMLVQVTAAGVVGLDIGGIGTRVYLDRWELPWGARYPEEVGGLDLVLKLFAFLASPNVARREEQAERPLRREVQRTGPQVARELAVHVVELGSAVTGGARPAPAGEERREVAWRQRWLVRGHYRNQW